MEQATEVDWERELADLLAELSSVQDDLLEVLSEKRGRMASGDMAGMNALASREAQLCDRLEACHRERSRLLHSAASCGLPGDSMTSLASALPGHPAGLDKQVKEASQRMRLLQHPGLTNWVLAQRTLLHLSQLLEAIASGERVQPTPTRPATAGNR